MADSESTPDLRQQLLERLRRGELPEPREALEPRIQPATGQEIPLSSGQRQVWLHSQIAPEAPIYNECITIFKTGPLDPAWLKRALNEIVRRHAIWRTGFVDALGNVIQVVLPSVQVPLPFTDLSHLSPEAAMAEALRLASEDAHRLFDLGTPPLLRARLICLAKDDPRLYLTFHHLVFDGVSIYRVFLPELASLYRSYAGGESSPLPELAIQYGDYAVWQQQKLENGDFEDQLNYWRETLKTEGLPVKLTSRVARPATPTWRAGMEKFELSAELSQAIKRFAASEGTTLYMTLLAAFHVLLHRYSGQEEIATGGVVSTRNRAELEPLIGLLLNTVVLRSHVVASLSFRSFLKQVRAIVLSALENSEVPFDAVVRALAPKRDSRRNAFFQILFSLRPSSTDFPDGWNLTEVDVHSGASGFDLFADIVERPDKLSGRLIYSSALFGQAAIRRMGEHFGKLLEGLIENPDLPLGLLPILTDQEREGILRTGIGPSADVGKLTICDLFQEKAAQYPAKAAVRFRNEQLTFRELEKRAEAFAAKLRNAGAGPGTLVSISVDRSLELVVALIGTLKTGAAYLPIDPSLPAERREFILSDAQPHLHVSSTALTITDSRREKSSHFVGLAYLLYTSGTTGVPKGVEVLETAVVNLLHSMQREPGFRSSDVLLAVTTLSFDIAVLELFLPLVSGGTLVIAPRETVREPEALMEAMRYSKCNVMQGTPAIWRSLIDAGWGGDPQLKILCGGEALSRGLADDLLPRCGELWNMYGPTETTIWSTIYRVGAGEDAVPIGSAIRNTQLYVLDGQRQLLPIAIAGELYIGGSGLARGYTGQPALTSERFVSAASLGGQRVYKTGDLARWASNGVLEFLGRADNQVKVRGHRVELQEIEEELVKHPGVRGAAVKAWRDGSGENALVAYLEGSFVKDEVKKSLANKLPEYMLPSRFLAIQSLPLTPNGKLDRTALPDPGITTNSSGELTDPRNQTEQRMAALWSALLNNTRPGIHEDFFQLGGHSLLAASLLRHIETEFGKKLGISALFENPTIASLSELVAARKDVGVPPTTLDSPVLVEPGSLHFVYAGAYCRHLAARLRPTHRLRGVSLPQELENNVRETDRFEDVAKLLLKEMQAEPPSGPYNLGGWCISGVLAYEVAVQLEALGERVGLVALLDAPNPQRYTAIPKGKRLKSKLRHHWKNITQLDVAGFLSYVLERARFQLSQRNPLQTPPFDRILRELALRYTPKPLRSRVVLFQGVDRPSVIDYASGWVDVGEGEFTAFDIPGNHVTFLEEPNVAVLAEKLKSLLS